MSKKCITLFYKVTLGYKGVFHFFLIFDPKHRLWVLVRTASAGSVQAKFRSGKWVDTFRKLADCSAYYISYASVPVCNFCCFRRRPSFLIAPVPGRFLLLIFIQHYHLITIFIHNISQSIMINDYDLIRGQNSIYLGFTLITIFIYNVFLK